MGIEEDQTGKQNEMMEVGSRTRRHAQARRVRLSPRRHAMTELDARAKLDLPSRCRDDMISQGSQPVARGPYVL